MPKPIRVRKLPKRGRDVDLTDPDFKGDMTGAEHARRMRLQDPNRPRRFATKPEGGFLDRHIPVDTAAERSWLEKYGSRGAEKKKLGPTPAGRALVSRDPVTGKFLALDKAREVLGR